ncbi:hypothetical protein [Streptomyces cacaoi]|uniref:hypothetical protein n=1 Tax=Streptomyces cacaoi TaxID=1898 RepID=UPI003747F0D1
MQRISEELLERFYRRAEAKRWKGYTRKRIDQAGMLEDFRTVYTAGPDSDPEEAILSRCLDVLVAAGRVETMRGKSADSELLPLGIHLLPVRSTPVDEAPKGAPLHPDLYELVKGQRRTTDAQRAAYRAISNWLHSRRGPGESVLRVPLRERALEIFGKREYIERFPEPEKCLDYSGFGGPLFQKAAQFYELIRAFPTNPPLLNACFSQKRVHERCTSFSGGDVLLVVENSATYTSLVLRLQEVEHRIGCVAWGVGKSFKSSVQSIHTHHNANGHEKRRDLREIRYFGDLDTSGLSIPAKASAAAVSVDLPPVRPTPVLYRELIRVGSALPGKERSERDEAEELVEWLGDNPDGGQVVDALVKGERWAQEAVGLRHLTTTDEWLADMQ